MRTNMQDTINIASLQHHVRNCIFGGSQVCITASEKENNERLKRSDMWCSIPIPPCCTLPNILEPLWSLLTMSLARLNRSLNETSKPTDV